jgi:hypothetical protein
VRPPPHLRDRCHSETSSPRSPLRRTRFPPPCIRDSPWSLPSPTGLLGNAAYARGDHEAAFERTQVSSDAASSEDFLSQMLWRSLRAKVHSRRGAFSEGVRLAREAVEVGRQTDSIDMQGDALMDLADGAQQRRTLSRDTRGAYGSSRALRAER